MKKIKNKGSHLAFMAIAALLATVPLLHMGGAVEAPLVIFLGKCTAFAIAAIALDLIWGYTGILSLGHGLYFSLGGYAMAMYLKLQATGGQITEFMHTGGLSTLPAVWMPFQNFPLAMALVIAVPGALAYIVGYFIFKNRVKGVYFSIISQALTWAAYSIFIALSPYTNGNVGITEFKPIFGSIRGPANQGNLLALFYAALALLIAAYALSAMLAGTKFGKLLIAIRDGENRTYFSGYRVSQYKTFAYTLSACLAGIAGAVFANFNGSITPSQMSIAFSVNIAIWVAIGGRGTLIGAVIGAFLINLGEYSFSSGSMAGMWPYINGGAFCLAILFFKSGIVGIFTEQLPALFRKMAERRSSMPKHLAEGDGNVAN